MTRSRWRGLRRLPCLFLVSFAIALVQGCLVPRAPKRAPDLRARTALPVSPASDTDEPVPGDGTAALDLKSLQEFARRRNPSVFEWRARVDAAQARTRQIRSLYFPQLRSAGRYLRLDDEVAFAVPGFGRVVVQDRDVYTQTTVIGYDTFDWGRRQFLHQSGLQEEAGTVEGQRRAMQELDFRVAVIYYSLFETQRDLDVARASVESLEGSLKTAQDLRAVDRVTEADVLVVEANLERRRFQARQIDSLAERLREDILHLLDLRRSQHVELSPPLVDRSDGRGGDSAEAVQGWQTIAIERRPELLALDAAHEAIENARHAELATLLPKVGLFVQHEHSTTKSAFSRTDVVSGGVNVEWELFSGLRRNARVDELRAQALEVRAKHRSACHRVESEVDDALRELGLAREGVTVAAKVVDHARKNLVRVKALFEGGRATGQELLEAESLLRTEEARQNRADYGVLRAIARRHFVCGLDFDEEQIP